MFLREKLFSKIGSPDVVRQWGSLRSQATEYLVMITVAKNCVICFLRPISASTRMHQRLTSMATKRSLLLLLMVPIN